MYCGFLILVHKNPEQVNILINQLLSDENNYIYVHISKDFREKIIDNLIFHPRVKILNESIKIEWSNDGILKAQLCLLNIALADGMDYFCFLTGQDLLIKKDINDYLRNHKDEIFINSMISKKEAKIRLEYYWKPIFLKLYDNKLNPIRILRRLRIELAKMGFPLKKKKTNKNIQKNIIYYKSYFWCAFPRNVGSYILNELKKNAYYKDLFFDAMCPEEVFWATLIMNSKYKDRIKTNQTLMYTSEFVNNHPKIIRYEDIDELKKTEYFFARKFDINVDSSVIEYYKKLICEEEI